MSIYIYDMQSMGTSIYFFQYSKKTVYLQIELFFSIQKLLPDLC